MSWKILASLRAPACLVENRNVGNTLPTLDYIPGSTLRGLLAQIYLEQPGHKVDDQFQQLFLNDAVSYPDLLPRGGRVIPLTALSCKYHPGFLSDAQHGVVDAVLPWLRRLYSITAELDPSIRECGYPNCKAPLDRLGGYYELSDKDEKQVPVGRRLLARTAILESREVARPGHLYTLEALAEEQEFSGNLRAADDEVSHLKMLLSAQPRGWIGTARSRGLGEVHLSLFQEEDQRRSSLEKRVTEFNRRLHSDAKITCFSVTLHSDVILLDELLGFRGELPICDLRAAAGGLPDVSVLNKFAFLTGWTDTRRIAGWQAVWGLPKGEEQALRRGSVFVYALADRAQNLSDEESKQLLDILSTIEQNGLGERPSEGFGRLRICDEFHWENKEK